MLLYYASFIILGVFSLIGMYVSSKLKSKFRKYSEMPNSRNMSGKEVAEKMLHDNNIYDVEVISVKGQLTDHYNPMKKTVNLSEGVYHQRNVAAAAVAAHECGHAVQHANAYFWLKPRTALVPILNIGSGILPWALMLGAIILGSTGNPTLLIVGIGLLTASALFSIITLPVEFDASARALKWMTTANITDQREHTAAKDALNWAAMTYVVAALAAVAQVLYWVLILINSRD